MADSDKDIVITPNTGAASDPSIVFSSGATGGDDVTLSVTDDGTITTLSIDGSAGQLLAISNDLTGTIFAVNDVSGIPSIEVDADGTIRLAEFDGDVGIGQGTPTHKLHITGPTTANTNAGIFVDSTGDAYLDLRADNTTGGAETNNPYVRFRQDQDAIEAVMGFNDNANDSLGNAVTGAAPNEFVIHNRVTSGTISLAVNGSVGLTVDDNDRVYIGQDTTGYLRSVSGDYGSIQVDGAEGASGTWTGYSIGGRLVLMDNVGSATTNRGGLYDDLNNLWAMQYNTGGAGNSELSLYYNGAVKLTTAADGIDVTGDVGGTTIGGITEANLLDKTATETVSGAYTFSNSANVLSGNITVADNSNTGIEAGYLGIQSTSGSDGHGLSLYNGYVDGEPTYGMFFGQTATWGSYGNATGDWNTYFTMNSTANRGWSFKVAAGSVVASIENTGYANFPRYYVGNSTTKYMDITTGYGSVNVAGGGTSSYAGYSINNDIVFMSNGTTHGIYNAGSSEWIIDSVDNGTTNIRAANTSRIQATTSGANVTGALTATTRLACTSTTEYFDTQVYNTTGITSSGEFKDHSGTVRDVGFNHVRSISQTSSTINPLDDIHCGSIILRTGSSTVSILMATGSTFPVGSMCTILNDGTGGTHTISANTTTMHVMDGSGSISTPASFALAIGGAITVWRQNTTIYYVWGTGIP